ncbi:hypothetical protein QQ045_017968 [Rhodiola kirilowii]
MEGNGKNNIAMNMLLFAMVLCGGLAVQVDGRNKKSLFDQKVVKGLNASRYMGRWFEIAKYPSLFEPSNAENTRATYTLKSDGKIDVLNEAFVNGKHISIHGVAYKADPKSDEAKLKVKFDHIPFAGHYWLLYVDSDYKYAVVGEHFRLSLIILSRENMIDDKVYNQLVQIAIGQGYNTKKLKKTPQTIPPPS